MKKLVQQAAVLLILVLAVDITSAQYSNGCAEGQFTLQNVIFNATNVEFDLYFQSTTLPTDPCHEIHLFDGDIVINFDVSLFTNITFTKIGGSNFSGTPGFIFDLNFVAAPYQTGANHVTANLLLIPQGSTPTITSAPELLGSFRIDGYNGSGDPQFELDCIQAAPPPPGPGGSPLSNDPDVTQFFTYNTANPTPPSIGYSSDVCIGLPCFYDTTPPQITCPPYFLADCHLNLDPIITGEPIVTDDCDFSISYTDSITGFLPCDAVLDRTWTAVDNAGNTSMCVQRIDILDVIDPTLTCPNDTSVATSISNLPAFTTLAEFTNAGGVASDNCILNESSFSLVSEVSDNQTCPETIVRQYMIEDSCEYVAFCQQIITVVCDTSSQGDTCCPDFKIYGDGLPNYPIRIKPFGGFTYLTGTRDVSGNVYATLTKLDNANTVVWQYQFDMPSVIRDFVPTDDGAFLLVGNTMPFGAGTRSILARINDIGTNAALGFIRSYDNNGREALTRIVKHPNALDTAYAYYMLGFENAGGTNDDVHLHNLNDQGNIQWSVEYDYGTDDQYFAGLLATQDGHLVLSGSAIANGNRRGILAKMNGNDGSVITATESSVDIEYHDGLEMNNGDLVFSARYLVPNIEAAISLFDANLNILSTTRIDNQVVPTFYELGISSNDNLYTSGVLNSGPSVICEATIVSNQISVTTARYFTDGESQFTSPRIDVNGNTLYFADARVGHPSGFGSFDMLVGSFGTDLNEACLVDTLLPNSVQSFITDTVAITSTNFTLPAPQLVISLDTNAYQCTELCPPTCEAAFTFTPLPCGDIQLTSQSTGIAPVSYCWDTDGNPSTCENTSANWTWSINPPCAQPITPVCLIVTGADGCTDTVCMNVSTIIDNTPPTVTCPPDLTVNCNDDTSPASTGYATFVDNCAGPLDPAHTDNFVGNIPCNGMIERTWMATDECGNTAACIQTITVQDTTGPMFAECPDVTIDTSCANDSAFINVPVPQVLDDCSANVQLTNDYNGTSDASDYYPEGTTTVIWTAIDECGNVSYCVQEITLTCDSCSTGPNTVTISDDLRVTGTLVVEGNKCFRIPHPLDPENKLLAHSCVESPVRLNIYSGVVTTDHKGFATVQLPDYFTVLNKNYRYQLTTIGSSIKPAVIWQEINKDGVFTIKSKKKHAKISWEVSGERDDTFAREHPFEVEVLRE